MKRDNHNGGYFDKSNHRCYYSVCHHGILYYTCCDIKIMYNSISIFGNHSVFDNYDDII